MDYLVRYELLVVLDHRVDEADGGVLHIDGEGVDLGQDVVVEELEDDRDDQTADGGDQSDLHTTRNNVRGDVTGSLDGVEGLDHADNGTKETEGRGDGDEQGDPAEALLHQAHLDGAVGDDGLFDDVDTLVGAEETLVEDGSDRAAGVAADFLGLLDATVLEGVLDLVKELGGVRLGEGEIQDSLDGEGETEDEADEHEAHEAGATFDELGLEGLVEGNFLTGTGEKVGGRLSGGDLLGSGRGGSLVLGGSDVRSEGHETGNCQKHEKLFHSVFENLMR